jgi:hypothetical protein
LQSINGQVRAVKTDKEEVKKYSILRVIQ